MEPRTNPGNSERIICKIMVPLDSQCKIDFYTVKHDHMCYTEI